MCLTLDSSYLFIAMPAESKIERIEYTAKLWDQYNTYRGNSQEVEFRAESVNHV